MNEFIQKLRLTQGLTSKMELKAAGILVKNQITVFMDYIQYNKDNIVWTNMVMPTEIFYAFKLIPIHTELIAGWLATLNLSEKYIQVAHIKGYNSNVCSYHKSVIGAIEAGLLPKPKLAVFSTHICDGGSLLARLFSEKYKTVVKLIDIPYHNSAIGYVDLTNQFIHLTRILEEYKKEKLLKQNLYQAIELSNEARKYLIVANNLRKKKSLFWGNLAIRNMYGASFLAGSKLGVRVANTYLEELKKKKEVINNYNRILWIHFSPLYAGNLIRYFEETLKCVIAFDITSYIYWNTLNKKRPFESMTQKAMSHFFLGDTHNRIKLYLDIIREYKIDGMVMFMQQGCRAIPGSSWEGKEITRIANIPFLELHGDCIDPEGFSSEQMKLRLEAFSEGVSRRKNVFRN